MGRYSVKYSDNFLPGANIAAAIFTGGLSTLMDDPDILYSCEITDNESGLVGCTNRDRSSKSKAYDDAWEDLISKQEECDSKQSNSNLGKNEGHSPTLVSDFLNSWNQSENSNSPEGEYYPPYDYSSIYPSKYPKSGTTSSFPTVFFIIIAILGAIIYDVSKENKSSNRINLEASKAGICIDCNGKGIIEMNEDCTYCKGQGKSECKVCNGMKNFACNICQRTDIIACTECEGNVNRGYIDCKKCKREGYIIDNQNNEITCPLCKGNRMYICQRCAGSGQLICPKCKGGGYLNCKNCNGVGSLSCLHCSGNGKIYTSYTCQRCSGIKKVVYPNSTSNEIKNRERTKLEITKCTNCMGLGYAEIVTECNTCEGRGYFACKECNGIGEGGCMKCGGTGKVLGPKTNWELITCPTCIGTCKFYCSLCDGKGKLTCSTCNGSGNLSSNAICKVCNGNKVITINN